jgi:hypothetical protein
MRKPLLEALWEGAKIVGTMFLAIGFMRGSVLLGATPLEAGFSAVVTAVIWAAFLVSRVDRGLLETHSTLRWTSL